MNPTLQITNIYCSSFPRHPSDLAFSENIGISDTSRYDVRQKAAISATATQLSPVPTSA